MEINFDNIKIASKINEEEAMIRCLKNNINKIIPEEVLRYKYGNPSIDLYAFQEYCLRPRAYKKDGKWQAKCNHEIIHGDEFILAMKEDISKNLPNIDHVYWGYMFSLTQSMTPSRNSLGSDPLNVTSGELLNYECFYKYFRDRPFYINFFPSRRLFFFPIMIRNITLCSKCHVDSFINEAMQHINNPSVNNFCGHLFYALIAKYLDEFCNEKVLNKIEKLLLEPIPEKNGRLIIYNLEDIEAVMIKKPSVELLNLKIYEALAKFNVEFVKVYKNANIDAHIDYVKNYCNCLCQLYNLVLAIPKEAKNQKSLEGLVGYISQYIDADKLRMLLEEMQKPCDEQHQMYFIPGFKDIAFEDESYRDPAHLKEEEIRKLIKRRKK